MPENDSLVESEWNDFIRITFCSRNGDRVLSSLEYDPHQHF